MSNPPPKLPNIFGGSSRPRQVPALVRPDGSAGNVAAALAPAPPPPSTATVPVQPRVLAPTTTTTSRPTTAATTPKVDRTPIKRPQTEPSGDVTGTPSKRKPLVESSDEESFHEDNPSSSDEEEEVVSSDEEEQEEEEVKNSDDEKGLTPGQKKRKQKAKQLNVEAKEDNKKIKPKEAAEQEKVRKMTKKAELAQDKRRKGKLLPPNIRTCNVCSSNLVQYKCHLEHPEGAFMLCKDHVIINPIPAYHETPTNFICVDHWNKISRWGDKSAIFRYFNERYGRLDALEQMARITRFADSRKFFETQLMFNRGNDGSHLVYYPQDHTYVILFKLLQDAREEADYEDRLDELVRKIKDKWNEFQNTNWIVNGEDVYDHTWVDYIALKQMFDPRKVDVYIEEYRPNLSDDDEEEDEDEDDDVSGDVPMVLEAAAQRSCECCHYMNKLASEKQEAYTDTLEPFKEIKRIFDTSYKRHCLLLNEKVTKGINLAQVEGLGHKRCMLCTRVLCVQHVFTAENLKKPCEACHAEILQRVIKVYVTKEKVNPIKLLAGADTLRHIFEPSWKCVAVRKLEEYQHASTDIVQLRDEELGPHMQRVWFNSGSFYFFDLLNSGVAKSIEEDFQAVILWMRQQVESRTSKARLPIYQSYPAVWRQREEIQAVNDDDVLLELFGGRWKPQVLERGNVAKVTTVVMRRNDRNAAVVQVQPGLSEPEEHEEDEDNSTTRRIPEEDLEKDLGIPVPAVLADYLHPFSSFADEASRVLMLGDRLIVKRFVGGRDDAEEEDVQEEEEEDVLEDEGGVSRLFRYYFFFRHKIDPKKNDEQEVFDIRDSDTIRNRLAERQLLVWSVIRNMMEFIENGDYERLFKFKSSDFGKPEKIEKILAQVRHGIFKPPELYARMQEEYRDFKKAFQNAKERVAEQFAETHGIEHGGDDYDDDDDDDHDMGRGDDDSEEEEELVL